MLGIQVLTQSQNPEEREYQHRILDEDNHKEGITSTEYWVENHGRVTVIG
jgi:hypothetical protein